MNLRIKKSLLAEIFILLLSSHLFAQDPFEPPSFGEVLGEQAANLQSAFANYQVQSSNFSGSIKDARYNYWKAKLTGNPPKDIADKYWSSLRQKDFFYLTNVFALGPNAITSGVDRGINPSSRMAFIEWANEVKKHLGGRYIGWTYMYNPTKLPSAIERSTQAYKTYLTSRNYSEMLKASYLLYRKMSFKQILRTQFMDGATGKAAFYEPIPEHLAYEHFDYLYGLVDKNTLQKKLDRVYQQHYGTEKIKHLGIAFFQAVGNTPIGYVIDTRDGNPASYQGLSVETMAQSFEKGIQYYSDLSEEYGKDEVVAASKLVMSLPYSSKHRIKELPDGRVGTPGQLVKKILEDRAP